MDGALTVGTRLPHRARERRRCRSWPRSSRPTRICSPGSPTATATRSGISTRRYARPVLGLALRRLGDRGRAEDATQEAFASVWRAARSYRARARARRAVALRRRAQRDRRPWPRARRTAGRARPTPLRRARPARARRAARGWPGACTSRSRRCPRPSARCSSSRTGAGCRRARSPSCWRPARHRQDENAQRAATAGRGAWRGAEMTRTARFPRARRRRGHARGAGGLRRAHDLLVAAGPPPELSPRLPKRSGRRTRAPSLLRTAADQFAFGLATAVAAAAFGRRLPGRRPAHDRVLGAAARRDARRRPLAAAHASLAVGDHDVGGQLPAEDDASGGFRACRTAAGTSCCSRRTGEPTLSCGTFTVAGRTITVRLSVPYDLTDFPKLFDGWVVTLHAPGQTSRPPS